LQIWEEANGIEGEEASTLKLTEEQKLEILEVVPMSLIFDHLTAV
jgi:hypothetical protein